MQLFNVMFMWWARETELIQLHGKIWQQRVKHVVHKTISPQKLITRKRESSSFWISTKMEFSTLFSDEKTECWNSLLSISTRERAYKFVKLLIHLHFERKMPSAFRREALIANSWSERGITGNNRQNICLNRSWCRPLNLILGFLTLLIAC